MTPLCRMHRSSSLLLLAGLLPACAGPALPRVALLADVAPSASSQPEPSAAAQPPATLPATFRFDVRPTAAAALTLTGQITKLTGDAQYVRNVADLLSQNLAQETALLMRQQDPEAAARAREVLDFNAALCAFLADALASPDTPERAAWIRWALAPAHMQLVAAVYGQEVNDRVQAARLLTDDRSPQADRLLAHLIGDDDREVSLRAIDSAWDRPPSVPLVNALWEKGVTLPLQLIGVAYRDPDARHPPLNPNQPQQVLIIRGQHVQIVNTNQAAYASAPDAGLAVDLLLRYNSPLVRAKVAQLFVALTPPNADTTSLARALSTEYGEAAVNARRLVAAYNPREALPHLLATLRASSGATGGYGTINMNGQNFMMAPQIDLLAISLEMMDQSPDDYGIVRLANYGNRWVFDGTLDDEAKSVKRLIAYWDAHYKDYGAATPDLPKTAGAVQGPMGRGMYRKGID